MKNTADIPQLPPIRPTRSVEKTLHRVRGECARETTATVVAISIPVPKRTSACVVPDFPIAVPVSHLEVEVLRELEEQYRYQFDHRLRSPKVRKYCSVSGLLGSMNRGSWKRRCFEPREWELRFSQVREICDIRYETERTGAAKKNLETLPLQR